MDLILSEESLQRKTFTYNIKIAIKEKPTIIYNKNSQSETKTPTDSWMLSKYNQKTNHQI
jgi:hypothetical protein